MEEQDSPICASPTQYQRSEEPAQRPSLASWPSSVFASSSSGSSNSTTVSRTTRAPSSSSIGDGSSSFFDWSSDKTSGLDSRKASVSSAATSVVGSPPTRSQSLSSPAAGCSGATTTNNNSGHGFLGSPLTGVSSPYATQSASTFAFALAESYAARFAPQHVLVLSYTPAPESVQLVGAREPESNSSSDGEESEEESSSLAESTLTVDYFSSKSPSSASSSSVSPSSLERAEAAASIARHCHRRSGSMRRQPSIHRRRPPRHPSGSSSAPGTPSGILPEPEPTSSAFKLFETVTYEGLSTDSLCGPKDDPDATFPDRHTFGVYVFDEGRFRFRASSGVKGDSAPHFFGFASSSWEQVGPYLFFERPVDKEAGRAGRRESTTFFPPPPHDSSTSSY